MADEVRIDIKAIVTGISDVRNLVREIERLPTAGKGLGGFAAEFKTIQTNLGAVATDLRTLGADTQRVMNTATVATAKLPKELANVNKGVKTTKFSLSDLARGASSTGNAIKQALEGNVLGALRSIGTALRTSIDFSGIGSTAVKELQTVKQGVDETSKVVTKFSSVLGSASKNAESTLSKSLFNDFGISAERALLNPQVALQKFVSGLAEIPDAEQRAIAVSNIFGASTAALLPSLEGMVAAEVAAGAAADTFVAAQTAATAASSARVAADEALVVATGELSVAQITASTTAAELAALESAQAVASVEATAAKLAETLATEALAAAEAELAAITAGVVVAEEAATVASLGLGGALAIAGGGILAVLAIAGAIIVGGFAIANSFANAGSKLHDMAEETGLTAEQLSVLKLAADGSGSSLEKVSGSFKKYLKNVNEAAGGNKAASNTFKQLGIDAEAGNKDSSVALQQLFVAISKLPPGAQQVNAAMKLAGKSGADLIPVINQAGGSFDKFKKRAEELGAVISTDAANAADKFGDTITELEAVLTGLKNQIGAALLPVLTELAQSLLTFLTDNKQGISDLASVISTSFTVALGVFYLFGGTVAFLSNLLYALITVIIGLITVTYNLAAAMIEAGKATVQFLAGDVAGAVQTITGAVNDARSAINGLNEDLARAGTIVSQPTFTSFFKLLNGGDGSTPKTFGTPKPKPTGSFKGGGAGGKPKVDPEIKALIDAQYEYEKAQIQFQSDFLRDNIKREELLLTNKFKNNLVGYESYYDQLRILQLRDLQAQVNVISAQIELDQKRLASAKKASERLKIETEILKLGNEQDLLVKKQDDITLESTQAKNDAAKEYLASLRDVKNALLDIEGRTADSAASKTNQQYKDILEKAQARLKDGDNTAQADIDAITRLKNLQNAQAKFNELADHTNTIISARAILEDELNNKVAAGVLSREDANAQLTQFEVDEASHIDDLVTGMEKYADAIKDPALAQAAAKIRVLLASWKLGSTSRDVTELQSQLDEAAAKFALNNQYIDTAVKEGATRDKDIYAARQANINEYTAASEKLLNALDAIAISTNNADLQAYVDNARAGLADLKANGDDLGKSINDSFGSAFTDLFTSIADGTKTAGQAFADFGRQVLKILADIAIKILLTKLLTGFLGGGGSGGVGGFLSGLLGGDKAVGGHAKGGYISGTGTGTSDSNLRRLSDGEFVINARATEQNRALLEQINSGITPQRALNAGNNVSAASSAVAASNPGNMKIVNVLPNDLLANYVTSGDGSTALLNFVDANAGAISQRLKQAG